MLRREDSPLYHLQIQLRNVPTPLLFLSYKQPSLLIIINFISLLNIDPELDIGLNINVRAKDQPQSFCGEL